MVEAGRPLDDVGEARRLGPVDLDELDLDRPHWPYAEEWSKAPGRPWWSTRSGRSWWRTKNGPAPSRSANDRAAVRHVGHGVGDLDDASELDAAGIRHPPPAQEPPNSPIGSPVPRRWHVSLSESTLRSPLRAAAIRWIDV